MQYTLKTDVYRLLALLALVEERAKSNPHWWVWAEVQQKAQDIRTALIETKKNRTTVIPFPNGSIPRDILGSWSIRQPEHNRWLHVIVGFYDDTDADFAFYSQACPHDGCSADMLTGFGGSGCYSDIALALCQQGHTSYFGPEGEIRVEREVPGDCWEHQHSGPEDCPHHNDEE